MDTCKLHIIFLYLQCVFHSIRFKVNKVLGHGGDPFLFLYPVKDTKKCGLLQGRISYDGFHSYLSLEIEEFSYFLFLNFR